MGGVVVVMPMRATGKVKNASGLACACRVTLFFSSTSTPASRNVSTACGDLVCEISRIVRDTRLTLTALPRLVEQHNHGYRVQPGKRIAPSMA